MAKRNVRGNNGMHNEDGSYDALLVTIVIIVSIISIFTYFYKCIRKDETANYAQLYQALQEKLPEGINLPSLGLGDESGNSTIQNVLNGNTSLEDTIGGGGVTEEQLDDNLNGTSGEGSGNGSVSEASAEEDENRPPREQNYSYFYDNFGESEREIYDVYMDLVDNKDVPGYMVTDEMSVDEYYELEGDFYCIYYAMLHDHPEFFYLRTDELPRLDISVLQYPDMVVLEYSFEPAPAGENRLIDKFERAADEFMSDIDLDRSDYEIELQIHDKLIEMATYDDYVYENDDAGVDLGRTAYGILVEDSNGTDNAAVCSGYAQAFQYFLTRAGIPCVCVQGNAGSPQTGDMGPHEWNLVMLDGEWYEVDSTWNDLDLSTDDHSQDFIDGVLASRDEYEASTHVWFNRTTDYMTNTPVPDDTVFTIEGYMDWNPITPSVHLREIDPSDGDATVFDYLESRLPYAYGTEYAFRG
ncbi:MAG: hypothetical protein K5871_08870 [Lachnospiraceae bacterium]|nr:hypothetical protein [Lachnospiraceae bacterium]